MDSRQPRSAPYGFRQAATGKMPAQHHSAGELAAAVHAGLARHPYLSHAQIVETPGDLPDDVTAYLAEEGLDPARIKGVYAAGNTYLIAGNLDDVEDGLRTALHEVVGHEGVRALLGEHFEPVMHDLYASFPREHEAWQTTAQRYGYLDTGTEAGQVAFAEELTAHMAEADSDLGEFDMIHAEIRATMREQVPDLPVTEKEVKALIQRSRESLIMRHGDPEAAAEVRERQAKRTQAAEMVMNYRAREGRGTPDAVSLALYRDGSQVKDGHGLPCRLYHGASGEVGDIRRGFWGSVDPAAANEYAAMRNEFDGAGAVVPYYANIRKPFDGDALNNIETTFQCPDGLTARVFAEELIRQSGASGNDAEKLRTIGIRLEVAGGMEESGPTYSPQDFWYMSGRLFGAEGEHLLAQAYELSGFDGVRYTEQGHLSYGAFSPAQVHFLDQGASPRGWQPDRHHGEGPATERPAFKEWFGNSKVTDPDGAPMVMYHGTTGDIEAFDESKIRLIDLDAACNGFWFSSRQTTSPAMKSPSSLMPVYLSIETPAPYSVVADVSDDVQEDGQWRDAARSEHDEVRYRLEDQGYDGFFFHQPTKLSDDEREAYARTGEVVINTQGGERLTLRHRAMPEEKLQDVEEDIEVMAFDGANGPANMPLFQPDSLSLLRRIVEEGGKLIADPDVVLKSMEQLDDLVAGRSYSETINGIPVERSTITITTPEWVETGNTIDIVDLYDDEIGHVTSYRDLDDFEAMHNETVATAFKPEQIKSAIGNRGTYLKNHPDIRFALGDAARDAQPERQPAPADKVPSRLMPEEPDGVLAADPESDTPDNIAPDMPAAYGAAPSMG